MSQSDLENYVNKIVSREVERNISTEVKSEIIPFHALPVYKESTGFVLNEEEKKSLKVLCQGAAIRFLLTRVFDYLNLTEGAIVKIKDPVEYLKRLEFHNSVKNYQDYFF